MQFNPKAFLRLDTKCFKAFMAGAETQNFTKAAVIAAMTQSGISQNIKKLEDQLGLPLFKRIDKNVLLTPTGEKLQKYVRQYMNQLEDFLDEITEDRNIEGKVSYAMPPSCSLSPHFPMLLEKRLAYPELELNVYLAPNEQVFRRILKGESDFGFVTEKVVNPSLHYIPFCQEEYLYVSHEPVVQLCPNELLEQKWIKYPGMEVYFDLWLHQYMDKTDHVDHRSLNYAGEINSISCARLMVAGGLGVSIFPTHTVQEFIEKEQMFGYIPTNKDALNNTIYIVTLSNYKQPIRVDTVINWFLEMHPERPEDSQPD